MRTQRRRWRSCAGARRVRRCGSSFGVEFCCQTVPVQPAAHVYCVYGRSGAKRRPKSHYPLFGRAVEPPFSGGGTLAGLPQTRVVRARTLFSGGVPTSDPRPWDVPGQIRAWVRRRCWHLPGRGLALKQGADCSVDIPHPLGIFGRVGEGVATSNSHTTKEVRPSPPPIPLPCAGGGLGAKPSSRGAPPLPARWAIGFMLLGCGWGAEGSLVPVPPPEGAPGSRGLWVGRGGVARLCARHAAGRRANFFFIFFFTRVSRGRPPSEAYLFCFVSFVRP